MLLLTQTNISMFISDLRLKKKQTVSQAEISCIKRVHCPLCLTKWPKKKNQQKHFKHTNHRFMFQQFTAQLSNLWSLELNLDKLSKNYPTAQMLNPFDLCSSFAQTSSIFKPQQYACYDFPPFGFLLIQKPSILDSYVIPIVTFDWKIVFRFSFHMDAHIK